MRVELNEADLEVLRESLRVSQMQLDIRRHKLRQAIESGPAEQVRSNSQDLQQVLDAVAQLAKTTSKFVAPVEHASAHRGIVPEPAAVPVLNGDGWVLAWVREFSSGRVINEDNMIDRIRQLRSLWRSSDASYAAARLHELDYHIVPMLSLERRKELE